MENRLLVTNKEAANIERGTRGQSNDEKWLEEREWRLTSSKFGQICKATERRDMTKLASSLLFPPALNNSAVTHGRVHEQSASDKFVSETGKQVEECGLFVSCEHKLLAATPDRLVSGEDALVEIKCPFRGREKKIQPGENFPFLESVRGHVQLRRNHDYYYQIVGQMVIAQRQHCYFVVFTFVDLFIEKISLDKMFFTDKMLPQLKAFFETWYCPLIVSTL